MDVYSTVEAYMKKIFSQVEGMKILLVDEETSGILSLVMSQSKLFEFDVFLVDYLGGNNGLRERQNNLNCVCLLRPNSKNIESLAEELTDPKYNSYHLFFTNAVKHAQLERIAEADSHELVKDFQEMFCDYFPLYTSLVSMNEGSLRMYSGLTGNSAFTRFTEGLSSLFYSQKRRPIIRYSTSEPNCSLFAKEINNLFDMNCDYFSSHTKVEDRPLLLITHRQDDPITPLLTQWTYQAMLHEFFAIKNGRIHLETPNLNQEYVMSPEGDSFYAQNLFTPIWQVAEGVGELVSKYQRMSQSTSNFSSIADMKRFMEDYPEYKRLGVHVNKHVTLAGELIKLAEAMNLKTISQFEQELVAEEAGSGGAQAAWNKIIPFLSPEAGLSRYHKLRLCMLVLAQVGIHLPLDSLSKLYGFSDDDVDFLKYFYLTRSGFESDKQPKSSSHPFGALKKGLMATFSSALPAEIRAQMTPLTKHVPKLVDLIDQVLKDRLSEEGYPYLGNDYESVKLEKPKDIFVVCIDGCTYEEARFIHLCNQIYPGVRVTLCSNFVHNSRSYISELVAEWQYFKTQSSQ